MFDKLLKPLTTATATGTVFRDVFIMVGVLIGLLGTFGVLTPEQVEELKRTVEAISGQWPAIMGALGLLMAAGMSIYRAVFKSSSNKAAEAAKLIDEKLAPSAPVEIITPPGVPDILVPGKKA
ncbi:hypothetical protein QBK99_10920 [Corticibacterium sp. UT-5YL-CI-8]|nr:hypothetical protein [Tianweitania sp. UT-5YL-CI-8]